MKRFKVLLSTILMVVAIITVTGVSFAAWIYTQDTEQSIVVDAGAWDAADTNTYNLEYVEIYGENQHVSAYKVVGFKTEMTGSIVRIPSTYNNLPVIAIASSFCQGEIEKIGLFKLVIPSSVKTIEDDALSGMNMLNTIVIEGNGLVTLGNRALSNCNSLTKVTLPESIKNIGSNVLYSCVNLNEINVMAQKSSINTSTGNVLVNFGLKSDGSYPAITFAKEAA